MNEITTEPDFAAAPAGARRALRMEGPRAGGCEEGWRWIREVKGDPEALRGKAASIAGKMKFFDEQAMSPGAGPRLYQEGFLRAVTTALGYIDAAERADAERPAG